MEQQKLQYYKKKLLEARAKILNSGSLHNTEDFHVSSDDLSDEADLATSTIHQQVSFSIRGREFDKLKRIEFALQRIEDGSYGYCLETGVEIEAKRLENQPWAEYCIEVAEDKEREEAQTARKVAY